MTARVGPPRARLAAGNRRSSLRSPLLRFLLLPLASCQPQADTEAGVAPAWDGTTSVEGSVRTVRTTRGSVWRGDGRLIEQAAIGTETKSPEDLLGRVMAMDATADRIFIADRAYTTVRVYDMAGNHLLNIGQEGGGPGEFWSITDLGIDPVRKHIVVREGSGVLHRLTLAGDFVRRIAPRGLQGSVTGAGLLLRVTRNGEVVLPHFAYRFTRDARLGYVGTYTIHRVDSTGAIVDSLPLPEYDSDPFMLQARAGRGSYRPEPVPFSPREVWSLGWDGSLITGHSGEYRFEIRYPDGRRAIFEREAEPVTVQPGERSWATDKVYGIMRSFEPGWAWSGPGIPRVKPWFAAIIPDRSGRLWVLREGRGRPVDGWVRPADRRGWEQDPGWVPEAWFEVFEEESGRYLGRVNVPPGFSSEPEPVIDDDRFICLTYDELGRPIVRRYRLQMSG